MDDLIEILKKELNLPYIEEDDAAFDGCFAVSPFMSSGLSGNGRIVSDYDSYQLDIFMSSKKQLMRKSKDLCSVASGYKGIFLSDPQYNFETNSKLWRTVITVQKVG